jgi:phospholipid/cholesterol/gamma-HCH transport system substrate-binding protein
VTAALRRRMQGVAFLAVLATLLGLAVGKYAGLFEAGVPVTLEVDRTTNQLGERADVKVRGLIVGEVESISTEFASGAATVALQLDPAMVDQIPAGVSARVLPKTLFGESYVSLVFPDGVTPDSVAAPISAGDVIPLDRSNTARQLQRALDGLLPLLKAVEPQDLATTLGAISQALEGRGEELGETLVALQELTSGLEPAIPDLQADITELADFAGNLSDAAPDLLAALEDLTVTSRTIVEQRENLRALLTGVTSASDDLRAFLAANRDNLIALADSSRPTLESLARYAPEFPCLFTQLAGVVPRLDEVFGAGTDQPGIHITLEIVDNRGKYVPGQDEPRYLDDRGPRCYPILPLGPQYPPDGPFRDGSVHPEPPVGTPRGDPEDFGAQAFDTQASGTEPAAYTGMGVANSPGEQQVVAELVAAQNGGSPASVPGWSTLLVGPLYRGSEVHLT